MSVAPQPHPTQGMPMPPMIAYTVQSSTFTQNYPSVIIDAGVKKTNLHPASGQDDSFWIVVMDANDPRKVIKDWVIPALKAAVPAGIETYLDNPNYLFAVCTQYLNTLHVPQGPFYDFLVKYGAGRELQKLEQLNAVLGCGGYGHVTYILTGQGGPRVPGKPMPVTYEVGSYTNQALLMMSLMPQMNGNPPYTICDSYSFK